MIFATNLAKLSVYIFKIVFSHKVFLVVSCGAVYGHGNTKISRKLTIQTGMWTPKSLTDHFNIIASSCSLDLCSILGHVDNVSNIYMT